MQGVKARLGKESGQSFVELALIIPVLLVVLAGLTEVGFFMFAYLNSLDLTREAARFASTRDFKSLNLGNYNQAWGNPEDPGNPNRQSIIMSACTDSVLHYYDDTACFFVDPQLNPYLPLDPNNYDDVTISVFSVNDNNTIAQRFPTPNGVWSLYNNNWQKDCQGNVVSTTPDFTNTDIENDFLSGAPHSKGLVLVEVYYCYHQVLNLPFISQFIANPIRLHTYSIMPAPEAIPTPTPIP
jgi:TadE-like protein